MTTEVPFEGLGLARAQQLVDLRESDEYAEAHVPDAQRIPWETVPARLHELSSDSPVYVIGGRSAQVAEVLTRAGPDARSVAGGTTAWIRGGRPVASGVPGDRQEG